MQGQQDSQRVLFDTIDLESLMPEDHLLRRIDARIDLDFVYDVTKELYCADNGRNSIDPVLFFRMQLISYSYGMKGDRELCREVHLNLAYRWFCRLSLHDAVPEHSSMTRIRDCFGEATFTEIFEQLIARWQKEGHIRDRRILHETSQLWKKVFSDAQNPNQSKGMLASQLSVLQSDLHALTFGMNIADGGSPAKENAAQSSLVESGQMK